MKPKNKKVSPGVHQREAQYQGADEDEEPDASYDLQAEVRDEERRRRLALRKGLTSESQAACKRILDGLYPKQRAVLEDPRKRKAVIATRQAGKTFLDTAMLVVSALTNPSSVNIYVVKNRGRAKDLLWTDPDSGLRHVLKRYGVQARLNDTDLKVFFPNGSLVELYGCEDRAQTEKIHGRRPHLVVLDEAGDFPVEALRSLLEDILPAGLATHGGTLVMTGTPGYLPVGRFYEITERIPNEEGLVPDWSVHRLTILDNVRYPDALARVVKGEQPDVRSALDSIVAEQMRDNGWKETSADYLRNFKGQWVRDDSRAAYRYDPRVNSYDGALPTLPDGGTWSYVLGGDCATEKDKTAAVVLAFNDSHPCVYQVDEQQERTPKNSDVEAFFRTMLKRFPLSATALDPSGMGNPTVRELRENEGLEIEVWGKGHGPLAKYGDQVRVSGLLADGRFKAIRGSDLEQQLMVLERDPRTKREKSSQPNDLADSFLYGFQRVLELWNPPLAAEPEPPPPPSHDRMEEDRLLRAVEEAESRNLPSEDGNEFWRRHLQPFRSGGRAGGWGGFSST